MTVRVRLTAALVAVTAVLGAAVHGQPAPDTKPNEVRQHYTKYEHRVAMRDGARLFTSVYVPKACDAPHPILLKRTPYSVAPYGVDQYPEIIGPSEHFTKAGFIVAYQDVRGRFM